MVAPPRADLRPSCSIILRPFLSSLPPSLSTTHILSSRSLFFLSLSNSLTNPAARLRIAEDLSATASCRRTARARADDNDRGSVV